MINRYSVLTGLAGVCLGVVLSTISFKYFLGNAEAGTVGDESIKNFIMNNPQVLIASVENMQREQVKKMEVQATENIIKYKTQLVDNKNDPSIGPKTSDVVVVEFFDYNCGYCKKMLETKSKLSSQDKVRIVMKELPVLGPSSQMKAKFALAVHRLYPDKYEMFHVEQLKSSAGTEDDIKSSIVKLGMDFDKVKSEAESEAVKGILADNQQLAMKLGIRGTPGYIIGDKIIPGYLDYDGFKEIISKQREAK